MKKRILATVVIAAAMSMTINAAPFDEMKTISIADKLIVDVPADWELEEQASPSAAIPDYWKYESDDATVYLMIFDTELAAEALEIEVSSLEDYYNVNYAMIDGYFSSDFDNAEYEMVESYDCGGLTLTGTTGVATGQINGEDKTGYMYMCYNSGLWYYIEIVSPHDPESDLGTRYKYLLEDFMTNAHPTIINGDVYDDADTVRKVQEELSNYGHPCTADGIMGPSTAEELKAYQADAMLSVNGVITDEVLESLEIP